MKSHKIEVLILVFFAFTMTFCKSPEDAPVIAETSESPSYILGNWRLHITHFEDPNASLNETNRSYLMNLNDQIFYTFQQDSTYLIHSPNREEPREGKWAVWKKDNQIQVAIPGMDPKLFEFSNITKDTLTGSSSVTTDAYMHFLLIRESNE